MKDLSGLYDEKAHLAGTTEGLLIPDEELYWTRLKRQAGLIMSYDLRSVTDLGCGYADLASMLPKGVSYFGVEPTEWVYKEARARNRSVALMHGGIENIDKAKTLTAFGLLAHMNPEQHKKFVPQLFSRAGEMLLMSFQHGNLYSGSLFAQYPAEIIAIGEGRGWHRCLQATYPGDTEVYLGFVKA